MSTVTSGGIESIFRHLRTSANAQSHVTQGPFRLGQFDKGRSMHCNECTHACENEPRQCQELARVCRSWFKDHRSLQCPRDIGRASERAVPARRALCWKSLSRLYSRVHWPGPLRRRCIMAPRESTYALPAAILKHDLLNESDSVLIAIAIAWRSRDMSYANKCNIAI